MEIGDKFARSLGDYSRWDQRHVSYFHLDEALDPLVNAFHERLVATRPYYGKQGDLDDGMFSSFLRARLILIADKMWWFVRKAATKCESPIERAMLYAITLVAEDLNCAPYYRVDYVDHDGPSASMDTLCIEPQAEIGKYRADFLLTFRRNDYSDHSYVEYRVVVECDGHDYHERTKEQARRDRARDRIFQTAGYGVYRFTGSEIWANAFGCAHEVLDAMFRAISALEGNERDPIPGIDDTDDSSEA